MRLTSWAIGAMVCLCGLTIGTRVQSAPGRIAPGQIAPGQAAPQVEVCLHGSGETAAERERREEALAAMRMIAYVLDADTALYLSGPKWSDLTSSAAISRLQQMTGRIGELANQIKWGEPEPLPDWAMVWPIGPAARRPPLFPAVIFTLTDVRDPCLFGYKSTDPEVTQAGRPGLKLLTPEGY